MVNNRPTWDNYFMNIAKAVSLRSTCLRRKYGAIIVKDKIIVATGYNGSPSGKENCCDRGTCKREELKIPSGKNYELCESVHAEANAIIHCDAEKMKGADIYIYGTNADGSIASGKPCLMCRRMIINAGIENVFYFDTAKNDFIWISPEDIQ